jgi:muramoyltetrapeptide carboxypeptidase
MPTSSTGSLIKPPKLNRGDTIGIVAPSLPLMPSSWDVYEQGKQTLRSLGFEIKEGQTIGTQRWWSAGTPTAQATDINAMFADPDVRALIALTGGFSSMGVVDLLDYDLIGRNPKPLVGMSDVGVYQWAMFTKCGLVGFHGNNVLDGFGEFFHAAPPSQQTYLTEVYHHLLTETTPLGALQSLSQWECWRRGSAHGRLLGGNLKRVVPLVGTAYFPPLDTFDDAILFWEELGDTLYDISFNLYKLKHLGIFDRIGGMVVGKLVWINQYFDEIEHPSARCRVGCGAGLHIPHTSGGRFRASHVDVAYADRRYSSIGRRSTHAGDYGSGCAIVPARHQGKVCGYLRLAVHMCLDLFRGHSWWRAGRSRMCASLVTATSVHIM